ncbi:Vacuolar ATP synthase subunit C [Ciborinia camelliae]|nr:Vacuolar ATP synthase subunit C [Ciborinia camelliae]
MHKSYDEVLLPPRYKVGAQPVRERRSCSFKPHHLYRPIIYSEAPTMSGPTKYMLVSLPTSISQSSDREEAFTALRSTISNDNGLTIPFKIPEFKIGTLDALVGQADDLAKLESACQGVVAKVGESLRNLLEGDESKIAQQKTVNDSESSDLRARCYGQGLILCLQNPQINTYTLSLGTKSNIVPTNHSQS